MIFRILAIILGLLVAQYSGAATINAPTCNDADVEAAVATAATGDTIVLPSGTCSTFVTIPPNKKLTIQGAGIGQTILNAGYFGLGKSGSRITAMTIIADNPNATIEAEGFDFRVDHVRIEIPNAVTNWGTAIWIRNRDANGPVPVPSGLIDSNEFLNGRVLVNGTSSLLSEGNAQHYLWSVAHSPGSATAVYVENNTFSVNTAVGTCNFIDGNYGGRYVFRYNTLNGCYVEAHSAQEGGQRGIRHWEVYGNVLNGNSGAAQFRPFRLRAGTGYVFANEITGSFAAYTVALDNVRSYSTGIGGPCNGASTSDGNQLANGYPCRDQIGRGSDSPQWVVGAAYTQPLLPVYAWQNRNAGAEMLVNVINPPSDVHIIANRDYYELNASFNGGSGMGCGTLAARPATCTLDTAYWATNQSCTSITGMTGPNPTTPISGTLYKCTSTNTWTVDFTPLTFPHPMAGGAPANVPPTVSITAPTNGASIVVNTATTITATAADSDGTVTQVVFKVDGATICTDTASPYSCSWTPTATGSDVITAEATDNSGSVTVSSAVNVTVTAAPDTTNPVVSITTPSNGATVASAISVAANCADNVAVVSVQFRLDGVNLGSADTSSPYSVTWDTATASNGAHTLTAVCSDSSSNASTSSPINVTVNNVAQPPASACPGVIVLGN